MRHDELAVRDTGLKAIELGRRKVLTKLATGRGLPLGPQIADAAPALERLNLAKVTTASGGFVSGDASYAALNSGAEPQSSADTAHGAYGTWPQTGRQWVVDARNQQVSTDSADVYSWQDKHGIALPTSALLSRWDATAFVPVRDAHGGAETRDRFNRTPFDPVTTQKLKLPFVGDGQKSVGVSQWKVFDAGPVAASAPVVDAGVDRAVVVGGQAYLAGEAEWLQRRSGDAVRWPQVSGPGKVVSADADATTTCTMVTQPSQYRNARAKALIFNRTPSGARRGSLNQPSGSNRGKKCRPEMTAMKTVSVALLLAVGSMAGTAAAGASSGDYAASVIGAPPAALKLDPFYKRYIDAVGLPIASSAAVPDLALIRARDIVIGMLVERPDLRRAMIARGFRVVIMAETEGTTDVPEQRDWTKPARDDPRLTVCERKHYDERIGRLTDAQYWNARARGMGGNLTSAATENLLGVPGTRYYGENIFVHEFSHGILHAARKADPALYARVEHAYAAAQARGLWKGEYGMITIDEYWAEGTQFWFNSNRRAVVEGHIILNDADLLAYDPALYNVLSEVYGDNHRLTGDVFYMHPARVPPGEVPGVPPAPTAEVC